MIVMGFRDIFYSFNQGQILIMQPMKSKFCCHLLQALKFLWIQNVPGQNGPPGQTISGTSKFSTEFEPHFVIQQFELFKTPGLS